MMEAAPHIPGLVRLERGEICVLHLGAPEEHPLLLTLERMESLRWSLEQVKAAAPQGLIITGAAPEMFCAGVDLAQVRALDAPEEAARLVSFGRAVFDLLAVLPCPTVAAISGPCVGGGCELALACTYRVITDDSTSSIGLPEVRIGIIPGFGGTARLRERVGIPAALDLILNSRLLKPEQAQAVGLVDRVTPYHALLKVAEDLIKEGPPARKGRPGWGVRRLVATKVGRDYLQRKMTAALPPEALWPAPHAALRAVLIPTSADSESQQVARLLVSPQCKQLIDLFFLADAAKAIGRSAKDKVRHALVLVHDAAADGVAAALSKQGCGVILQDNDWTALDKAQKRVEASLTRIPYWSDAQRSFAANRIEYAARDSANLGNVTIVIDVSRQPPEMLKRRLTEVHRKVAADAIIAVDPGAAATPEIFAGAPQPERLIGLRFFEPAEKMPLAEILYQPASSAKSIAVIAALLVKMGKYPVAVKESPGGLLYRMTMPLFKQAAVLLECGMTPASVDAAAELFGMRIGPFRLMDQLGLDQLTAIAAPLAGAFGDRLALPEIVSRLAADGRTGVRSQLGFYRYRRGRHAPVIDLLKFLPAKRNALAVPPAIEHFLFLPMLNEAVRCLDEGVAGEPGPQAAGQIALASVVGAGFPAFRGGILRYGDELGWDIVAKASAELELPAAPGVAERSRGEPATSACAKIPFQTL